MTSQVQDPAQIEWEQQMAQYRETLGPMPQHARPETIWAAINATALSIQQASTVEQYETDKRNIRYLRALYEYASNGS